MPTVLVLYPGSARLRHEHLSRHRSLVRASGMRLVLADSTLTAADREYFDELIPLPGAEHVAASLSILEKWCAGHALDGVFAQWEPSLPAGALLAERLGLPGAGVEAAYNSINKLRSRTILAAAGLPVPAYSLASSASDVKRFAASKGGYPVVVKGVASALGRLVTFVAGEADVERAVERVVSGLGVSRDIARLTDFASSAGLDPGCDPLRQFLVERYVPGAMIETDGIIQGGAPLTYGVTEQVLTPPPMFRIEGYLLPAQRPSQVLADAERLSSAASAAVGLLDTGFSIEMRERAGQLCLIEVNGRLGWDEGLGELFQTHFGVQPALHALQVALGSRPVLEKWHETCAALAYVSCYVDARVTRVPNPREVEALERAGFRVGLEVRRGSRIHAEWRPEVAPHLAWALAIDSRSSRSAYERARHAVGSLHLEWSPLSPEESESQAEAPPWSHGQIVSGSN